MVPGRHSETVPGDPCVVLPGDCPGVTDPSGSGDGGRSGGVGTLCDEYGTGVAHADFPGAYVVTGDHGGDDGCRMCVKSGSARPDATPGENSRHCSLFLLCSCPPACLRCMGSARANRSGRSPDSGEKLSDGLSSLWAAGGLVTSLGECLRRAYR